MKVKVGVMVEEESECIFNQDFRIFVMSGKASEVNALAKKVKFILIQKYHLKTQPLWKEFYFRFSLEGKLSNRYGTQ